ncbi:hypothetical protein LJC24_05575, partial [Desulfococcaceae bacterium OttesenSCG-928-F15]|nr:hypothetical protein [Desulfococcaceae bacterium OttesenSCG-928-F15]
MSPFSIGLALAPQILGDYDANLDALSEFAGEASRRGAGILVFPEMHLTGYPTTRKMLEETALPLEKVLTDLLALSLEYQLVLVCGFAERAGDSFFVTQLVTAPEGILSLYRKIHLGPPERALFEACSDPALFTFHGIRFGLQLCYDAHFPELSTHLALSGAEVLLIPHASPRGTSEEKKESWMRHLPARAFDTGSYVLCVNPVGWDGAGKYFPGLALGFTPDGKLFSECLTSKPELLLCEIDSSKVASVRSHPMTAFHLGRR